MKQICLHCEHDKEVHYVQIWPDGTVLNGCYVCEDCHSFELGGFVSERLITGASNA